MKKTVFLWLLVVCLITTTLLVPVSLVLYSTKKAKVQPQS